MLMLIFLLNTAITLGSVRSDSLPVILPAATPEETRGVCSSLVSRNHSEEIKQIVRDVVVPVLNSRPPCACGGAGEWTRMAYLNMSDLNQHCPSTWTLITTNSGTRGCGRSSVFSGGCDSAFFPSNGRSYSRVCGRIIAYQQGSPSAFQPGIDGVGLEGAYVEGVSLTHGAAGSRQHIWTFAEAVFEMNDDLDYQPHVCACTNTLLSWPHQVPSFVGNNYFCDTGDSDPGFIVGMLYENDPLWDGEGCGPSSACCQFNNPPWFCTTLPQPTTDDLELRICNDQGALDEDAVISLVDIYVK